MSKPVPFLVLAAILALAGPTACKKDDPFKSDQGGADGEPGLRQAFSDDDLLGVEVVFEAQYLPLGGIAPVVMAGLFPTDIKSQIRDGMTWESADPAVLAIGPKSGYIFGKTPGKTEITGKYGKFSDHSKVEVKADENQAFAIPDPASVNLQMLAGGKAKLTWVVTVAPVAGKIQRSVGTRLAYKALTASDPEPQADCDANQVVTAETIATAVEWTVEGLAPAMGYSFRVCTALTLTAEDLVVPLSSSGIEITGTAI